MTIEEYEFKKYRPSGYPIRHKRKVPFRPLIKVPSDYADRVREIRQMDTLMGSLILSSDDYLSFFIEAIASSIHHSTMLEGNPLQEEEVRRMTRKSVAGEKVSGEGSADVEILNHISVFSAIISGVFVRPWSEEKLLRLHSLLFRGVLDRTGFYRTDEAHIETNSGNETFIPAPAIHVRDEVISLLEWLNEFAPAYDPIVAAAVFFHEFESIHPFENGNGRMGRILLRTYLQRYFPSIHLCKIEENLLKNKELYYDILGWTDENADYSVFIDFLSSAILEGYKEAKKYFSKREIIGKGLDEVALKIVSRAKGTRGEFTVNEANSWIHGVGYETIRKRLNELVELGVLRARGNTRSRRYCYASPLQDVRERFIASTEYADYFLLTD